MVTSAAKKRCLMYVDLDGHFVIPTHNNKIVVTVTSILLPGPREETVNCPLGIETESLTHTIQSIRTSIHISTIGVCWIAPPLSVTLQLSSVMHLRIHMHSCSVQLLLIAAIC